MDINCAPAVADLFYSVMRETSCCLLSIGKTNLKLLNRSILLLGIWMTY